MKWNHAILTLSSLIGICRSAVGVEIDPTRGADADWKSTEEQTDAAVFSPVSVRPLAPPLDNRIPSDADVEDLERALPGYDVRGAREAYGLYLLRDPFGMPFDDYLSYQLHKKKRIGAGLLGGGFGALVGSGLFFGVGLVLNDIPYIEVLGIIFVFVGSVAAAAGIGLITVGAVLVAKYGGAIRRHNRYRADKQFKKAKIEFRGVAPLMTRNAIDGMAASFAF